MVVGDAPYAREYIRTLHATAGPACCSRAASTVTGIASCSATRWPTSTPRRWAGRTRRWSESMGFGNCTLVHDSRSTAKWSSDAGLFFDARRPDTLAALLNRVAADPGARRRAPRPRHGTRAARFSWESVTDQYEAILLAGVAARMLSSTLMISERARLVSWSYFVSDMIATAVAFVAAHSLRSFAAATAWIGPIYPLGDYAALLTFILPSWALVFYFSGFYGRRSSRTLHTEFVAPPARAGDLRVAAGGGPGRPPAQLRQPAAARPLPAPERDRRGPGPRARARARAREHGAAPRAGRRRAGRGEGRGRQRRSARRLGSRAGRRGERRHVGTKEDLGALLPLPRAGHLRRHPGAERRRSPRHRRGADRPVGAGGSTISRRSNRSSSASRSRAS